MKSLTKILFLFALIAGQRLKSQDLIISEVLTNPNGNDSPFEYVELLATNAINFSLTPYTVIFCNNGNATSAGWIAGGSITYGFSITSGNVNAGDIVYVGGSSMLITGTKLRVINTATSNGDRFGTPNTGGVLGNGGTNADGVAVFNVAINSITNSTVPVDAIFFGTGLGSAVVSSGSAGYQLPSNDNYTGGKLNSNSYIAPDPAANEIIKAIGVFNTANHSFSSPRTWSKSSQTTSGSSSITLENTNSSIVVNPSSLSFTSNSGSASLAKSISLQGNGLTSTAVINAPVNFEVSLSTTFTNSLSLDATIVNSGVTIYVRYNPLTPGTHSGELTITSNSITQSVLLNGTSNALTPIYSIQGNTAASSYDNSIVFTEGIVTASFQASNQLKGFYIQSFPGDGDPSTSDGIFVYDNLFGVSVSPGDLVQLEGEVDEFNNLTEIKNLHFVNKISSGNTYTATSINLPITSLTEWEQYEGMYLQFSQTLTVTENYTLGRYGELLLSSDGRLMNPTNSIDPNDSLANGNNIDGSSNIMAIQNQQDLNKRRSILLDDASNVQNPSIVPYLNPLDTTLRVGTTTNNLSGILDYSFGAYRIHPISNPVFVYAQRPAVPNTGIANLKVASFNVLNYFNGDGNGGGFPTPRGANTLSEFNRQRAKIIEALKQMNADVVGLMEMENDGDGSKSAIADLVNGLNAATFPGNYAYIADPKDTNGFSGTDQIKVALIYKPAVLLPFGPSISDTSSIFNRPPLAQHFKLNSNQESFTLIVNHFKSKSCTGATGSDVDLADGQGCYNDRRRAQSLALLGFIDVLKASMNENKIITIGDINAYEEEDPMDVLKLGGLTPLSSGEYSYVFNGASGSLDHALVNAGLIHSVLNSSKWHINADEPILKDYNQEFNPAYVYKADAFRSSDHDPLLIGLLICPTDINKNGTTDNSDFLLLLSKFGTNCPGCAEDINSDGVVNNFDFLILLGRFGSSCN